MTEIISRSHEAAVEVSPETRDNLAQVALLRTMEVTKQWRENLASGREASHSMAIDGYSGESALQPVKHLPRDLY